MKYYFSIIIGTILGVFLFITIESKAPSYLSEDSSACANCHVMLSAYNSWEQSSHRDNAECADCHIPHENIIRKYAAKASDGARHAYAFTFNTYEDVLRVGDRGKSIIQHNCIRCHEPQLLPTPTHNANLIAGEQIERTCWSCHRQVPHGAGNSISSSNRGLNSTTGNFIEFPKK